MQASSCPGISRLPDSGNAPLGGLSNRISICRSHKGGNVAISWVRHLICFGKHLLYWCNCMKLQNEGETLRVSGVRELGAANSNSFRDWVRSHLIEGRRNIEIDLSETTFLDSCGLGALISLHKAAQSRQGAVRLLRPQPQVDQILSLTRMHHIFDIVRSESAKPTEAATSQP